MTIELDAIGDVHGAARSLRIMLRKLGYSDATGTFIHPKGRIAIFTGDLVDSGPDNLEVVEIVKAMVMAGSARAIMGNHDFNVVAFNTRSTVDPTRYLRPRTPKNALQCATTQAEIDADPVRGRAVLEFLAKLPLWLDLGHSRFVHASWDQQAMATLKPFLDENIALTGLGFGAAAAQQGAVGDARSVLLSGPEIACEPRADRYGHMRTVMRHEWWLEPHASSPVPVFFGHYALIAPLAPFGSAICLDAGVAKGGPLVAFRHKAGTPPDAGNYVYV